MKKRDDGGRRVGVRPIERKPPSLRIGCEGMRRRKAAVGFFRRQVRAAAMMPREEVEEEKRSEGKGREGDLSSRLLSPTRTSEDVVLYSSYNTLGTIYDETFLREKSRPY